MEKTKHDAKFISELQTDAFKAKNDDIPKEVIDNIKNYPLCEGNMRLVDEIISENSAYRLYVVDDDNLNNPLKRNFRSFSMIKMED